MALSHIVVTDRMGGVLTTDTATCLHCDRPITLDGDLWVDPTATGDGWAGLTICDARTGREPHQPMQEGSDDDE